MWNGVVVAKSVWDEDAELFSMRAGNCYCSVLSSGIEVNLRRLCLYAGSDQMQERTWHHVATPTKLRYALIPSTFAVQYK